MSSNGTLEQGHISGPAEGDLSIATSLDPGATSVGNWTWTGPCSWMTFTAERVLEIGFSSGTILTVAALVEMQEQFLSRSRGLDARMIIDVSGLDGVAIGIPPLFSKVVAKNRAAILGSGPADRVLARFFMRKLLREHQCAYFEHWGAAREYVVTHA